MNEPDQSDRTDPDARVSFDAWRAALAVALAAFTIRGRAFIAGGVTAAACGIVLGERDLVRIGVLIAAIPVLTAMVVARGGQRLSLTRTVAAPVVAVNQTTTVTLELTNIGSRTGLLLVEEQVPWALGQRPRFVIGWLRAGRVRSIQYPVRAEVRGIYDIGPLMVTVADPFAMLSMRRVFPRTTALVVIPGVEDLPALPSIGAWSGSGDNRPQPFSVGSTADASVREYRLGDDLRRVHWRSTARTGELMVRREEQPWQARCTLLVDNRASAHRGAGPDSSLERAVTVTASIAVHLIRLGFHVRLVSADGNELEHIWHDSEASSLSRHTLEHLAGLPASRLERLAAGWIDDSTAGGLIIGVLGRLDGDDHRTLARLHAPGSASYAISLDIDSWAARAPGAPATSTQHLRNRGWRATDLARGGSLQAAWTELGR